MRREYFWSSQAERKGAVNDFKEVMQEGIEETSDHDMPRGFVKLVSDFLKVEYNDHVARLDLGKPKISIKDSLKAISEESWLSVNSKRFSDAFDATPDNKDISLTLSDHDIDEIGKLFVPVEQELLENFVMQPRFESGYKVLEGLVTNLPDERQTKHLDLQFRLQVAFRKTRAAQAIYER